MEGISYQLRQQLQDGECSSSYRGVATLADASQRQVLIKILQPHLTQDPVIISHLAGFLDVARGLSHPGISPVWDFGRAGDYYFVVFEYLPGISLAHLLQMVHAGKATLSPAMAVYLTQEVASALVAIHRYRVPGPQPIYLFHGGLSPSNVILSAQGGVVLTDSGLDVIFWREEQSRLLLQQRKGDYHPPEYGSGQRPTRRGDIYSTGSILYEMILGCSLREAIQRYGNGHKVVSPSVYNNRVTEQFDQVILRCLHPAVDQRFSSIEELKDSLNQEGLLRQLPVEREEAIAYVEAVVQEELDQVFVDDPPEHLLFSYQFMIESLLPQRPELPAPQDRYRPPVHPSTGQFHPSNVDDVERYQKAPLIQEQDLPTDPNSNIPIGQPMAPQIKSTLAYDENPLPELGSTTEQTTTPPPPPLSPDKTFDNSVEEGTVDLEESAAKAEGGTIDLEESVAAVEGGTVELEEGTSPNIAYGSPENGSGSSFPPSEGPERPQGLPETVAIPLEEVQGSSLAPSPPGVDSPPPSGPTPTPPPTPSSSSLGEQFGKFVLLNRIALGGMAEVFRAKIEGPEGFQRLLAVKRILPQFSQDPNFLQMFKDEARIAGNLNHPNIVQIYELGEIEGNYFISMEYIEGIDLARAIKIRRLLKQPLPVQVCVAIATAVCRGLDYAHDGRDLDGNPLNMIHRDVTPHNVLLSEKGEIKLTDFGIAKASQNITQTAVGELKGKLSYMSPEQADGKPLQKTSDIYQVGILLYEMVTLQKLFEGSSEYSILSKIREGRYRTPAELAPHLSVDLEQIILKALNNDTSQRYQTAAELEQALLKYRDSMNLPHDAFDVAPFVGEILRQRDEILEEQARLRQEQNKKHTFSVDPPPPGEIDPLADVDLQQLSAGKSPKEKKSFFDVTSWPLSRFLIVLGVLLLLGGGVGGVLYFTVLAPPKVQKKRPKALLSIKTTPPGVTVTFDGQSLGKTPVENKELEFDTDPHTLQLYKPGYRLVTKQIEFSAEKKTISLQMTLQKIQPAKRTTPPPDKDKEEEKSKRKKKKGRRR